MRKACFPYHGEFTEGCKLCRKCRDDKRFEKYLEPIDAPRKGKSPSVLPDCVNLGKPTGEEVSCVTCGGNTRLKTFSCSVYGSCTIQKKVEGHGCCSGCPSIQPHPH